MPSVKKSERIIEKITTQTKAGEMTINLNLRIVVDGGVTVDNGEIRVVSGPENVLSEKEKELIESEKIPSFEPEPDKFDMEMQTVSNFGQKIIK